LERGVVSEFVDCTDSLTTPPQLKPAAMSLKLRVYLWWLGKYQAKPEGEGGGAMPSLQQGASASQEHRIDTQSGGVTQEDFGQGRDG